MIRYRAFVRLALKDGHPVQVVGNDLSEIMKWMLVMKETYPTNKVVLVEVTEREVLAL